MSNGLGAGFAALSILAALIGLSLLVLLTAGIAYLISRRTGRVPGPLRYLLWAVGAGVLAVAGFGVLALYDEAPPAAGLFASIAVVPLLVVGVYLDHTTEMGRADVLATTVMAWGPSFLLGGIVAFGVMAGFGSVFGLAPAESRRLGVPWIAAAAGGITTLIGMVSIATRLAWTELREA